MVVVIIGAVVVGVILFVSLVVLVVVKIRKRASAKKEELIRYRSWTRQLINFEEEEEKKEEEKKEKKNETGKIQRFTTEEELLKEKEKKEKQLLKRGSVIFEVCQTEETYVGSLENVVSSFIHPMRSSFSHEDLKVVFSSIEVFLPFHKLLLSRLTENLSPNSPQTLPIGKLFCELSDFMKNYPAYINNYSASLRKLDQLAKDQRFKSIRRKARKNSSLKGLDLKSLLIMPIQRVPRYVLLLQETLKNTPNDHPDFQDLTKAVEKLRLIASLINESKRSSEQCRELLRIQQQIVGLPKNFELLEVFRRFIRTDSCACGIVSGKLHTWSHDIKHTNSILLFNDMILFVEKKDSSFRYLSIWNFENILAIQKPTELKDFSPSFLEPRKRLSEISTQSVVELFQDMMRIEDEKDDLEDEEGGRKDKEEEEREQEDEELLTRTILIGKKSMLVFVQFESARVASDWIKTVQTEMNSQKDIKNSRLEAREEWSRDIFGGGAGSPKNWFEWAGMVLNRVQESITGLWAQFRRTKKKKE